MSDITLYTDIGLGAILFVIIVFLFLKDSESNKKLKKYEKSIEDLHYELFKIKKEFQELQESVSRAIDSNKQITRNQMEQTIKSTVDEQITSVMKPLFDSLNDFDNTLRSMQDSIDTKINRLNDQVKEVTAIPSSTGMVDKYRVIEMAKDGKDSEFISRELRTTKGEIDFILRMANYI